MAVRTAYLKYVLRNHRVVIGIDRKTGETVGLHVNGVDYTKNGMMEHEVAKALEEAGINTNHDYIDECLRLDYPVETAKGARGA